MRFGPFLRPLTATLLLLPSLAAAEHPTAEISNEMITARLYLPDAEDGYYRGTRFDWSGVVHSLTYKGHQYFGEWQESEDPLLHDRITGPVEEYRTNNAGLGYDESGPAGRFIRIGIGVCQKPAGETEYQWTQTYDVVDPGKWTVNTGPNWIEFIQELDGVNGYAYRYTKRMTLPKGKPELVLRHTLRNTGKKTIESNVYNHNFFVIDSQPTGPDFVVRFPFELRATRDLKGIAEVRGKELVYLKEVSEDGHISSRLEGFGDSASDHQITIENRKTRAGVHISTDKPLSRINYWSPRTTLCPEPYIDLLIKPGDTETWTTTYRFYTLD